MPYRSPHQCPVPGCPNRVTRPGRCVEHAEQASRTFDLERGTSTDRGYGAPWRKIREAFLKENPYCVMCWAIGREVQAQHVDHIIPKRNGGAGDPSNFQSLCQPHHSAKTMRETNRRRGI